MEEIKIRELPSKGLINSTDYIPVEDEDGTKKVFVKHFRSLITSSLYFNTVQDLKNSDDIGLREGDICETLGYYTPGDGGAARYRITYNPSAIDDGKMVHDLMYSSTLKAEIILDNIINVHQLGAKGDGVTDDTDAIQTAINNSDARTVKFNNNKSYVIRNTININKSNTIIEGDGGILYPHFVDGIYIGSETIDNTNFIHNIRIHDLNFDCSKATSAVVIDNSYKVDIVGSMMTNITSKGIRMNNSEFINIDKCYFLANEDGSMIVIDGTKIDTALSLSSRTVNITNCIFKDFYKGIYIMSSGNNNEKLNTLVNLKNCHYVSKVSTSCCIDIASPIQMLSVDSNTVDKCNTFLSFGGASTGNVACKNISCLNTRYIFNIGTQSGILNIAGSINMDDSAILFKQMQGKLHSNIAWGLIPSGANYEILPIGEIFDNIHPALYDDMEGYSISGNTLTLSEARNIFVDWDSASNLSDIRNGIKGQLLYIKSSTDRSIIASENKIVLTHSSIALDTCAGIMLKFDGLKWIQIQV